MADRHHIDPDARIQSIHLRNPRNFRCRQANTNRKQSVLSVGQQSEIEYRCLQKCRQTSRNDLLAPAVKSVCVTSRNSKKIQTSHSNLTQHYAASLDVRKHDLYCAVTEKYDKKQTKKRYIRGKNMQHVNSESAIVL